MFEIFFRLLFAHALADFALQPEAMCKGKNKNITTGYVAEGQKYVACWRYWLSAHALICGGMVYWATGSLLLGILETGLHWMIDFAKCENITNPNQDQALHLMCRLIYLFIV
jgi:hypothetical protein